MMFWLIYFFGIGFMFGVTVALIYCSRVSTGYRKLFLEWKERAIAADKLKDQIPVIYCKIEGVAYIPATPGEDPESSEWPDLIEAEGEK